MPIVLRTVAAIADLQLLRQTATGDVSHKPCSRLPLLSASPRLPSQLQSVTAFGWCQFILLGEQRQMFLNCLPRVAA